MLRPRVLRVPRLLLLTRNSATAAALAHAQQRNSSRSGRVPLQHASLESARAGAGRRARVPRRRRRRAAPRRTHRQRQGPPGPPRRARQPATRSTQHAADTQPLPLLLPLPHHAHGRRGLPDAHGSSRARRRRGRGRGRVEPVRGAGRAWFLCAGCWWRSAGLGAGRGGCGCGRCAAGARAWASGALRAQAAQAMGWGWAMRQARLACLPLPEACACVTQLARSGPLVGRRR